MLIYLLLFDRWKGSIYKLVWPDLIAFLSIYYALSILYRYVLDPEQKKWVQYFKSDLIKRTYPLSL